MKFHVNILKNLESFII